MFGCPYDMAKKLQKVNIEIYNLIRLQLKGREFLGAIRHKLCLIQAEFKGNFVAPIIQYV